MKDFLIIEDHIVRWEPYKKGDSLYTRFLSDEWYKAVADIHSDDEWYNFLSENNDFANCYILKRQKDNHSIAFLYILNEYDNNKIVSIHGGGWESPLLYYRGYVLFLKNILENGYKVRTYCSIDNKKVIRLSKGIGYRIYKRNTYYLYMWLSLSNLKNSKIYNHFYPD